MDFRSESGHFRGKRARRRHGLLASLVIAVSAVAGSCGDGTIDPDEPAGTISVSIDGITTVVQSAGTALITGTGLDEPLDVLLPPVVTGDYDVPVGTYHVVYGPPAGYTIEPGSSNEIDVIVTEDDTTVVSFTVVQASGTLQIGIDGLDASSVGGGSAQVLRTDIGGQTPLAVAIPAAGNATTSLVPGTYSVTYTPPANHSLIQGEVAVKNVVVEADEVSAVSYEVQFTAPIGTIAVEVTGLTQGAANGGSASAVRTDVGGSPTIVIAIPAGGFADSLVAAGTYSVTYSPPSGHVLAPGETNPQTVVITPGGGNAASFEVDSAGPAPEGVVFASDWGTAVGQSDAAMRDTESETPWSAHTGNGRGSEIVSSDGFDFPSPNVLAVIAEDGDGDGDASSNILRYTSIPVPAAGESLFYRWYIRVTTPDEHDAISTDPETHPIQDGFTIGDTNWAFQIITSENGTWRASYELDSGPNSGDLRYIGRNVAFEKDVTYRFELQLHRINASQFNLHSRVYDSDGVLLYDDDDWHSANGETTLAENPTLNFNSVANLNGLNAGFNGLGGPSDLMPFPLYIQGAFCVRTDDWCGPYEGGI